MCDLINIINESQNNSLTNKKDMTLSEYIQKQDNLSEGKKMALQSLVEASSDESMIKSVFETNEDRKIGDTLLNIKGVSIPKSVILYKSTNVLRVATNEGNNVVKIDTFSKLRNEHKEIEIYVPELKLIETII
jgi:hypothetical protein